jgi:predicted TIM-barrel fold metal-dependent hydrolase
VTEFAKFDADGHVFERDTEIFEHLEPPFCYYPELAASGLFPRSDDWNRQARNIFDGRAKRVARSNSDGTRFVEPQRWIEFLDEGELDGAVLYPTAGLAMGKVKEPEWAVPLARAYNNWLKARFLDSSPKLKGVAVLPMQEPDEAAKELRRAVSEVGMVAAVIPAVGLKRYLGDSMYDPVYQTAQELDVPLAIHGGAAEGMGLDAFDKPLKARTLSHPFAQLIQLTDMMYSGLFDRFPTLRISFMEAGVGWLVFLLDRMGRSTDLGWMPEAPELKRSPREHLTSGRIFFHCEMDEKVLPYAVRVMGDDALLYASDFPHQPPSDCIAEQHDFVARSDLADESKAKILGANARRLYNLAAA